MPDLLLGKGPVGELHMTVRERSTHLMMVGAIGSGKTNAMEVMLRQDINKGRGVCLIDPMGSLYGRVLDYCRARKIPPERIVILNPSEADWITPFNPFVRVPGDLAIQAENRVHATVVAWRMESTNDAPTLEKWLTWLYGILIEKNLTVLEAGLLIDKDPKFRDAITSGMDDSLIGRRLDQLARSSAREFFAQLQSTDNRLNRFEGDHTFARILGAGGNAIDAGRIMDEGKILLVNLSLQNNRLSLQQQRMIGALLVNEFYEAAMRRKQGARPFYFYLDEAGLFVTPELGHSLDHCRQKGLHITFAFQHLHQFKAEDFRVYKAVMNSARSRMVFQVQDREDAAELADSMFFGLAEPEVKLDLFGLSHEIKDEYETVVSCGYSEGRNEEWSTSNQTSLSRSVEVGATKSRQRTLTRGRSESCDSTETYSSSKTKGLLTGHVEGSGESSSSGSMGNTPTSAATSSGNTASSEQMSEQENVGESDSVTFASGESTSKAAGTGIARSVSRGMVKSGAVGESHSAGQSAGRSVAYQRVPVSKHFAFRELRSRTFWSLEEQRWKKAEEIMRLPSGFCFVQIQGRHPELIKVPYAVPCLPDRASSLRFIQRVRTNCCLPRERVDALIEERHRKILELADPPKKSVDDCPPSPRPGRKHGHDRDR